MLFPPPGHSCLSMEPSLSRVLSIVGYFLGLPNFPGGPTQMPGTKDWWVPIILKEIIP